jgi:hypothetical protein
MQEGKTHLRERKDLSMLRNRNHTHPRSERHGDPWVQLRWNALSKRSPWQGFSGRFGDSPSRRSRSVPGYLVRASSGVGRTQRKHFAVGESRRRCPQRACPRALEGLCGTLLNTVKLNTFRFIFTLFHLRDSFDKYAKRLMGQGVWREAQRKNAGNGLPCQ